MLKEKISSIREQAIQEFDASETTQALYDIKVKYLGKQGQLSQVMKQMKDVPKEDRPKMGQWMNEAKTELEEKYEARKSELEDRELEAQIENEKIDLTVPGPHAPLGSKHPIELVTDEIIDIFSRLGYYVRLGPMIETDENNFGALNIPPAHPARDMQDTFYIDENHSLRPHTSPIQVRTMRSEKPPIYALGPGSVFRCDSDISHSPMFHQIECLAIDKKISMADLKGTVTYFAKAFFGEGIKTRFRPSFFPFTEPSAEVDCSCPICKGKGCRMCGQTGWVEIGGCGLVHPNVLNASGIDSEEFQGFAFGMGIERMAIIKYGIQDIRLFFENDLRFLEQFRG